MIITDMTTPHFFLPVGHWVCQSSDVCHSFPLSCVFMLSLCVLIRIHRGPKDAVTIPNGRFPNKEKLHVLRIKCNTYPSLSFYITSWGFFCKENSWDLLPNKLNMALAAKQLTIQIPEVGSGSLLRDGGHVKLICGQAFITSTQSASASSGPGYDDMTSVCVYTSWS